MRARRTVLESLDVHRLSRLHVPTLQFFHVNSRAGLLVDASEALRKNCLELLPVQECMIELPKLAQRCLETVSLVTHERKSHHMCRHARLVQVSYVRR